MLLAGESEQILIVTTALAQRKKNPTRELSGWVSRSAMRIRQFKNGR
jgi:hypothetical protein